MSSILSNVLPAPEDPVLSVHIFQFKDLHPSYIFIIGSILPFYERVDHFLLQAFNLICMVTKQVIFACRDDPCPVKLNLIAGAYRTEEGKPLVLEVVRKAEQQLANDLSCDKGYLPIDGLADFNKLSAKLILGDDSHAVEENRVVTIQCLSGTGSLRVGAEFLAKHHQQRVVFVPNPTWGNHPFIFTLAGLSVEYFRYYDPQTRGLDFEGMLEDLGAAPSGAIVVLQSCAHNPTGIDPTLEQWEKIRQIVRSKGLLPFFDNAYQVRCTTFALWLFSFCYKDSFRFLGSHAVEENRVVTIQCLSGTGSLRVGAEFLAKHHQQRVVFVPNPTWGNHPFIFTLAGLSVEYFRYYDPQTRGLDFEGMLEDLGAAPSGAIVVLQSCAHNPTGIDPTLEQWEKIRQIVRSKGLLPFFDNAYQGFASGNLDSDAQSVRMFVADGGECLIAQSFAKNMGLYGERIGALTIVCTSQDVARKIHSQVLLVVRPMYLSPPIHGASIVTTILKNRYQVLLVVRPMYLSPPIHGASIVTTILKNSDMYKDWTIELKGMADRIISMRQQLYEAIQARGTPGDWSHIIKQIGMFSFTGLNEKQVRWMAKEYHIYMTYDGRISIASLSSKTVPQLADAIHAAVTRLA
ncbi:hypothetical protein DY000_02034295 [Brassica cretica]|uniref:Aspartate aminotransferase n=1 Tax=Brassica cretica TaxID=69181 RepID=A0ABQ7DS53_BRACR|nr:hypothetical protein DY000_02034295 [Brassica cretica]